ncbi:MAG: hypothetical protein GF344_09375 [Chitinivibrionales bacterium]|nr:hypothetical protein [Chitinivibrionales bacterium]MBD3357061.1 hypothetical protein [Chitinivibrionales bacterium]
MSVFCRRSRYELALLMAFSLCCFTAINPAFAQEVFSLPQGNDFSFAQHQADMLLENGANGTKNTYLTREPNFVDKQIDPAQYILGPGDELSIFVWGTVNASFISSVGFEGNVVIPKVGVVKVGGKSLEKSREIIIDELSPTYKGADISVLLRNIREFKVYVLGQVKAPGAYQVDAATRVSDAIAKAGGCLDSGNARRHIEIKKNDGQGKPVDLALFYHANVDEKNPYLTEGDRIYVHPAKRYISITGAVNYAGRYDYMDGDSLGTIIRVAGGLSRGADSSRIILSRFAGPTDTIQRIRLRLPGAANIELHEDDRVHVYTIPEYRVARNVVLTGEVQYPGVYPIEKDQTRLREILERAGGLTKDAFHQGTEIKRESFTDITINNVNTLLKVLQVTQVDPNYLDPAELSYIKSKITESEQRISVDVGRLFSDKEQLYDIILRDGDRINVPRVSLDIKVTGAVANPGLVPYKKGNNHLDYIDQAGGFLKTSRRRDVRISTARTGKGVWLSPGEVDHLSPGDVIFVPERIKRDRAGIAKDLLSIIGSATTITIGLITIFGRI